MYYNEIPHIFIIVTFFVMAKIFSYTIMFFAIPNLQLAIFIKKKCPFLTEKISSSEIYKAIQYEPRKY